MDAMRSNILCWVKRIRERDLGLDARPALARQERCDGSRAEVEFLDNGSRRSLPNKEKRNHLATDGMRSEKQVRFSYCHYVGLFRRVAVADINECAIEMRSAPVKSPKP